MPENPQNTDQVFDSTNLIVYLYNWRKPLFIVTIIAAVLAAIFSGSAFIEPQFESTVTVFPSTTNSLSKALLPQKFATRGQDRLSNCFRF
jgi:LPS O-antigen subunit length determinant protein (WzzB/FepE family)